ncbi:DUF1353 domain-containing protein [Roseovarius sp. E0-M6]|uniref:DUF1353 domain-containing protein n=1 Tax=Roseovarius sp. E0-M6 TaxID=3127118 RepID=UPI00300F8E07
MRFIACLAFVLIAGCAQFTVKSPEGARVPVNPTCKAGANCHFVNSPVKVDRSRLLVIPSRDVPFYPTTEQVDFVDGTGSRWVAHEGIVTDGASIPPVFVSIVGDPTSPEFINAAAVHDAYCGIGNEEGPNYHTAPWHDVHVMFYDALRVGGVPEIKAKVMFAAVWLGGPRWPGGRPETGGALAFAAPAAVAGTPSFEPAEQNPVQMRAAMRRTKAFVEANNPSIPALVGFITGQERGIAATAAAGGAPGGGGQGGGHGGGGTAL